MEIEYKYLVIYKIFGSHTTVPTYVKTKTPIPMDKLDKPDVWQKVVTLVLEQIGRKQNEHIEIYSFTEACTK